MKKVILLILLGMINTIALAQKFEIKGSVVDSVSRVKLQSATVFLESIKDSTLITYSITDANGVFILKGNTGQEQLNFFTSFTGYKEYTKTIDFKSGRTIDLGTIELSSDVEFLDGIVVKARKAPITVKKDTLEFNAKSFNTQADATLEDVIKELPGVEVTKDGKITVNGKEVNRILVNGKEFFGDDPQVALKNLPKEIIDKIQVTDSKTEEQKLTGEEGDPNISEINITIDEDKNKGWFSRLTAGAGTMDRYSASGIVNYFKDDFRVSVLGSSNNINSPGFSFDEIYDAMGNSAYSISRSSDGSFGINGINFGGGNNGITSSRSAGLNVANDWDETAELSGSYFFGDNDTETATDSRTTTFLPDDVEFNTSSSRRGRNAGISHRLNAELRVKFDTLTSINIEPSYSASRNENFNTSNSISSDATGNEINNVSTSSNSLSDRYDAGLRLNFYKRGKKKGNFISLNAGANQSRSESDNDFFSETFVTGATNSEIQDQLITQETDNDRWNASVRLGRRITDTWRYNINYRIEGSDQRQDRRVFNRDSNTGNATLDGLLSNDFSARNFQNRPSVGLSFRKEKFRFSVSGGLINQQLTTENSLLNDSFKRTFNNLSANAFLSKGFGKYGNVYFNYRLDSGIPNISQLQPVEDRTNPQNIVTGNPNLDARVSHNIYMNLNRFNWEEDTGFYSGLGFTYTDNQVARITTTDANLLRETTFVNIDGVYNGYSYFGYTKGFKKDSRTIKLDIGMDANLSLNKSFSNAVPFDTRNLNLSPNIGVEYSIDDILELETEYTLSSNRSVFSIDSIPDQEFINHTASIDLTTFWPENVTFGIRGEYNVFGNVTEEFDNDSFVLIGSLGYKFAKDKAIVKLKAYDILNQVINTRRNISQDFVSDTTNLVLQQYFMLSLTYKFSKFGGKDPNS